LFTKALVVTKRVVTKLKEKKKLVSTTMSMQASFECVMSRWRPCSCSDRWMLKMPC